MMGGVAMRVHVGSSNVVKREAVRRVFQRVFPQEALDVKLVDVSTGSPSQPFDDEVPRGALHRARQAIREADYGVGIEAGLIWNEALQVYFDVQFCAVLDRQGKTTMGHGAGFIYPQRIVEAALSGQTVGEAMSAWTGIAEIGRRMGAIGALSRGLLDRTQLTEQAVLMALLPRIQPEFYRET
jgi:inosine/xanthosine triphosphatase